MYLLSYLDLTMTWCKALYLAHVHIFHSMPGNALIIITIGFSNHITHGLLETDRSTCSSTPNDRFRVSAPWIRNSLRYGLALVV
jgi:hypothetical protein